MTDIEEPEIEKVEPIEIIDKTPKSEPEDKTSWETEDPWDIINMTEEDIKEAEESRNA